MIRGFLFSNSLLWRMAARGLLRHARRNFVSALAIALGFSGLALMGGYIVRVDKFLATNTVYSNYTGHLSIFKADKAGQQISRTAEDTFDSDTLSKISRVLAGRSEIEFSAEVLRVSGLAATGCRSMPFVATGVERDKLPRIEQHPEVRRWTPDLVAAEKGERLSQVAPEVRDPISMSTLLALAIGKPKVLSETGGRASPLVADCRSAELRNALAESADIQLITRSFDGDFSAVDAQIVGQHTTGMAFTDETSTIASLDLLRALVQRRVATYVAVYLRPGTPTRPAIKDLTRDFAQAGLAVEILPFYDVRIGAFYHGVMRFLLILALFFMLLVIAMVSVTIVNFITVGLLERTREIGTMRAIGFDVAWVRSLFLRESVLLTAIGLLLGLLISFAVSEALVPANIRFSPPGIAGDMQFLLYLTPALCLFVGVFIASVALASAVWRLRKMNQMNVVDLLNS